MRVCNATAPKNRRIKEQQTETAAKCIDRQISLNNMEIVLTCNRFHP